jgi:hypothetical protein
MGGYSANKTRKILGNVPTKRIGADACDLEFRVDLVGVTSQVSRELNVGDVLDIALIRRDATRSVVCCLGLSKVVGTLAAFKGLAQLISCIEGGNIYLAYVEAASAARCSVRVARAP